MQNSCTPGHIQLLQAFRPASLDRSRLAEVTRLTDSRKARTGLRRAGLFYSQFWPASFASGGMGHVATQ